MTKEKIEAQLQEYRKQREQLTANLNAVAGAIQAMEALLREEEEGGEEKKK